MTKPATRPASQPAKSAKRCTGSFQSPSRIAGSVWRMITPPISCRSIENCGSSARITSTAPAFVAFYGEALALRLTRRDRVGVDEQRERRPERERRVAEHRRVAEDDAV